MLEGANTMPAWQMQGDVSLVSSWICGRDPGDAHLRFCYHAFPLIPFSSLGRYLPLVRTISITNSHVHNLSHPPHARSFTSHRMLGPFSRHVAMGEHRCSILTASTALKQFNHRHRKLTTHPTKAFRVDFMELDQRMVTPLWLATRQYSVFTD